MRLETLNEELVSWLRAKIIHPNPNHDQTEWIYLDYPRLDATFPRISVTSTDTGTSPVGIGERFKDNSRGRYFEATYDIDVWIKKGNIYTIVADNTKRAGSRLRDYLSDEIIKFLMSEKESFWKTQKNVFDLVINAIVTVPYMDEYELFRKTITVTFSFYRSSTT